VADLLDGLGYAALAVGALFFVAGTLGLLRFPDAFSRLHAVTKADTLGLGFVVLGLGLLIRAWQPVLLMVLIWLLVMASSATACQLLARYQREDDADQTEPDDAGR
jgi:multicomponent Na+:H+ antiporter subunit G